MKKENPNLTLREACSLAELLAWRAEVIRNVFGQEADTALLEANEKYYAEHVPDGSHYALIAALDGEECGCGAICFGSELPSPDNPSGLCAYLMNIYVREPYRNHGVAHRIVSALTREALRRGCGKIYLEATPEGKPVYTSSGFKDMPDMMKYGTEI